MTATRWVGCAAENFHPGRPFGHTPRAIVLHRTGGSLGDLRARFADPRSSMSSHYAVGRDGAVEQYVSELDTAFQAGVVVNPSWTGLAPNVNPNFYTIGIEHEGGGADWPDAQCAASAALIAEVADRWSIGITKDQIVPHSAIRASVACPGANCPIDAILGLARSRVAMPVSPAISIVRALVNANLRKGVPSRSGTPVRVITAGAELIVSGVTNAGERINGNASWYIDGDGHFLWAGATDIPFPVARDDRPDASPLVVSTDEMELHGSTPSGQAPDGLTIDRTTLTLPANQYYAQPCAKDMIVLHFTAGATARGAVDTWRSNPEHVATAYIIDTDGTIYEVFPPRFWAYHLGIKGGTAHERRSIGIEIVNVGPLQPSGDDPTMLNWWPPGNTWKNKYCSLEESGRYVKATYRDKEYFATFADSQLDAMARLARHLCDQFDIKRQPPVSSDRLACSPTVFADYKGIATHANFRADKWDIGPAFDWDRLDL